MSAPYLLRVWGRDIELFKPEGFSDSGSDGEQCYWFPSSESRAAAIARSRELCLVTSEAEGDRALMRLEAHLVFQHYGEQYRIVYDFGYGYEPAWAWWMFHEGNYACDDNRSLFIKRQCNPDFPEMSCGDSIKLIAEEYREIRRSATR